MKHTNTIIIRTIVTFMIAISCIHLAGQDPLRFQKEVENVISNRTFDPEHEVLLFTGSSSVRIWSTLSSDFPSKQIVNTGFGGSTFVDLMHYKEELIFRYGPSKIFIYEGDNDISMDHSPTSILANAKKLVMEIKERLPECEIYLIAAKPSLARWNLREAYNEYNYLLKSWSSFEEKVHYVDVWTPMCDDNGHVMKDIFIEDGLHMNSKGYQIWTEVFRPMVMD